MSTADPIDGQDQTLATTQAKANLFISYSRKDSAFVDTLAAALEARGYDVRIDRSDITKGEEWWKRIVDLIIASTLVVFVISPDSIASSVCKDEVEFTKSLGKRIVPLMRRKTQGLPLPEGLSERDWVSFEAVNPAIDAVNSTFGVALDELEKAINLDDVLWAREHAIWLRRAHDWHHAGRPDGAVMRATEITGAQVWIGRKPAAAPPIPTVVTEFIAASLAKEDRDREALDERERRISQGLQNLIGLQARLARDAHRHNSAIRIALAGEPSEAESKRGVAPSHLRRVELAAAAQEFRGTICLAGHSLGASSAAFSPNATQILTASPMGTARVWDASTGTELVRIIHNSARDFDQLTHAAFSLDGARVLTVAGSTALVSDARSGAELLRFAHEGEITSAVFSPDGARVVTASKDKTARVWHLDSGAELARFAHDHVVESVAISPDGARILTASDFGPARVWNSVTRAELVRLVGAGRSAAFSPEGARVVTWGATTKLWDAQSGAELRHFPHDSWVNNAMFSLDGMRVLTASMDRTARVWAATSGTELVRLVHRASIHSAAFSPDGARVVTASRDKTARVWDARSGAELACLVRDDWVESAAFSPDGSRVVTASRDEMVRVWDTAIGGRLVRLFHQSRVEIATFSPDAARVVTASESTGRLWDAFGGAELVRFAHDDWVESAAFSPDGMRVVTASRDMTARVWDARSGAEVACLVHDDEIKCAVFSPDGMRVVTASRDMTARVWDARSGAEVACLVHDDEIKCAVFSPDGMRVLTASRDKTARVWNVDSGAELARFVHDRAVVNASFSPDGGRVVTAAAFSLRIWDVVSRAEFIRIDHNDSVKSAIFSPDGTRTVTASHSMARVWDAVSGSELVSLGHNDEVRSAVFSPDAARVLTASKDKTARVWDVESGAEIARFIHDHEVRSARFSPDGTRVVTASDDGIAQVWDVTWVAGLTGDKLVRAVARTRLVGEGWLTDDERRTLGPILGEGDYDVVSRWLAPSPDDAEIEAILALWQRNRELALALARQDWARRAEEIRWDVVARQAQPVAASENLPSQESEFATAPPRPNTPDSARSIRRPGLLSRLLGRKH